MTTPLEELSEIRRAILLLIKQEQRATIGELAAQLGVTYFLYHQVPGKAASCLDDDGSNAIALDPRSGPHGAGSRSCQAARDFLPADQLSGECRS